MLSNKTPGVVCRKIMGSRSASKSLCKTTTHTNNPEPYHELMQGGVSLTVHCLSRAAILSLSPSPYLTTHAGWWHSSTVIDWTDRHCLGVLIKTVVFISTKDYPIQKISTKNASFLSNSCPTNFYQITTAPSSQFSMFCKWISLVQR